MPPELEQQQEKTTETPDLRASVEAAFDKATSETAPAGETAPQGDQTPAYLQEPQAQPAKEAVVPPQGQEVQPQLQPQVPPDDAPKAWKAGTRNHWAALPKEVKDEVLRREKDFTRVFGESGQARQFSSQVMETVRPYEARMRLYNVTPIQAINRLFQVDHILSSAPPTQRAQFMATLIHDYGIDIKELDSALAGEASPDPVQSQLNTLLEQRLAPLNQFLQQQQVQAQQADFHRAQQATSVIDQMAQDTANFPHFEQVREAMADIVDLNAARGRYPTLDVVYKQAVGMDPELGPQALANGVRQAQLTTAQAQHAQAQRAQAASLSVSGSKSTAAPQAINGDLRSAVEAAWAAHSGR